MRRLQAARQPCTCAHTSPAPASSPAVPGISQPEGSLLTGACTAAAAACVPSISLSARHAPWRTSQQGSSMSTVRRSHRRWKGQPPSCSMRFHCGVRRSERSCRHDLCAASQRWQVMQAAVRVWEGVAVAEWKLGEGAAAARSTPGTWLWQSRASWAVPGGEHARLLQVASRLGAPPLLHPPLPPAPPWQPRWPRRLLTAASPGWTPSPAGQGRAGRHGMVKQLPAGLAGAAARRWLAGAAGCRCHREGDSEPGAASAAQHAACCTLLVLADTSYG